MFDEQVRDWMSTDIVTVDITGTLPEAHALMKEKKIRRLPVLDEGRLVGIVTLGDIREASPSDATSLSIYELNYLLAKLDVESIMTREPLSVSPSTKLSEAAKLMLNHKIGGLPVLDGEKLVGMITESDIFRAFVRVAESDGSTEKARV